MANPNNEKSLIMPNNTDNQLISELNYFKTKAELLQDQLDCVKAELQRSDDDMNQPGETVSEIVRGVVTERDNLKAENKRLKTRLKDKP